MNHEHKFQKLAKTKESCHTISLKLVETCGFSWVSAGSGKASRKQKGFVRASCERWELRRLLCWGRRWLLISPNGRRLLLLGTCAGTSRSLPKGLRGYRPLSHPFSGSHSCESIPHTKSQRAPIPMTELQLRIYEIPRLSATKRISGRNHKTLQLWHASSSLDA